MENEIRIFHYLHDSAQGTILAERLNDKEISFTLPDGKFYKLEFDHREKKNIAVFDGELLYGGLPKNARVSTHKMFIIKQWIGKIRKESEYLCVGAPDYQVCTNGMAKITVARHFLFLPACVATVRKYKADSLSPIYVAITSTYNEKSGGFIEWRNSSY